MIQLIISGHPIIDVNVKNVGKHYLLYMINFKYVDEGENIIEMLKND